MSNEASNESIFQVELSRLLQLSTLTPGSYEPTSAVKSDALAAVFVGDNAAILCGPADDPASIAQADVLATSKFVEAMVFAAQHSRALHSGVVAGAFIAWQASETAIVAKPSGHCEPGSLVGRLMAIVLNDPTRRIATALCINTESARILDPAAPVLNDGHHLSSLPRPA